MIIYLLLRQITKQTKPNIIKIEPAGNAFLSSNQSMANPARRDPKSMPRLWAMVKSAITDPMAPLSRPFITEIAIKDGKRHGNRSEDQQRPKNAERRNAHK